VLGLGIYQLSGPIQTWTTQAPATVASAQRRLRELMVPLERLTRTAKQVEDNIAGPAPADKPQEVVVARPTVVSLVFGWTSPVLAGLLEVAVLLYFLLAAGDLFLEKVIRLLPQMHDKKKAVLIARETESAISTYLITNLGINAVEGLMVFGALWAIGLPNAIVWGVLTVVLEFIPYLGALVMLTLLTVTALSTFDDVTRTLLVPGSYLLANIIQANIVTAMVLGRRLQLNPVAVLVGLAFWFWIWGVPGAFIAVPLMSIFKICCDHMESLATIGEFLGGPETRGPAPERMLERTLG
jgi:predicted PurR-regulated permease PerM